MFGYYQQIVYLCTVLMINTAPKILKKRELGKYCVLKRCNEGLGWKHGECGCSDMAECSG